MTCWSNESPLKQVSPCSGASTLGSKKDELREEMAEAAPLLQVTALLAGLQEQAQLEATASRERVVVAVVAGRDAALLEQLRASRVRAATIASIEQFLAADRTERDAAAAITDVTGLADPGVVGLLTASTLPAAARRLRGLVELQQSTHARLDQAERIVVAIPDPESLAPLQSARAEASAELLRLQAATSHADERLLMLRHDRARADAAYESAMDKAAQANLAADDDRRLVEHIDRVRTTLEGLRGAATHRHLDHSELILEALAQLLRKEKLVTGVRIDPDSYTVELTGIDGRPLRLRSCRRGNGSCSRSRCYGGSPERLDNRSR